MKPTNRYSLDEIETLTNHDGLLCKPPWRNAVEQRQYYARFVSRYLWRAFDDEDWKNVARIADDLRVPEKLKRTTKFLAARHIAHTPQGQEKTILDIAGSFQPKKVVSAVTLRKRMKEEYTDNARC